MSATSSKSRIVLFLLVAVALVFFLASFIAAAFTNSVTTAGQTTEIQDSCIIVQTGDDKVFSDCSSR